MRHADFFAYARERHAIHLRRSAGQPPPWTDDPVLRAYRFTNVFRELDATTQYLRRIGRALLRTPGEQLLGTVVFRWFCRQDSGEVIFGQGDLLREGETPWLHLLRTGSGAAAEAALRSAYPAGPWTTGSYMIRSPDGVDKLRGLLSLCERFWEESRWRSAADYLAERPGRVSMKQFTRWLERSPGLGPFLAYEVACDLRWSGLLSSAPDVMTWANVGPGALDGLGRVFGRRNDRPRKAKQTYRVSIPEGQAVREMQVLLGLSQDPDNWPPAWGSWEMREVEHTLCEFAKYERTRLGEGRPRRVFRSAT